MRYYMLNPRLRTSNLTIPGSLDPALPPSGSPLWDLASFLGNSALGYGMVRLWSTLEQQARERLAARAKRQAAQQAARKNYIAAETLN